MARRSRFLFLESQYIDKPISHLKYSRKDILPDAQDYNFLVPFFTFKITTRSNIEHTITSSSSTAITPNTSQPRLQMTNPPLTSTPSVSPSSDTTNNEPLLYTVENFNPLPDSVDVPEELRRFIPQAGLENLYVRDKFDTVLALYCTKFYINYYVYELYELYETVLTVLTSQPCPQVPVYNKKKTVYYPPGSPEWFNVIKKRARKAEDSAQLKQDKLNSYNETLRMKEELQQSAKYHGTSTEKFHEREEFKSDLTRFQNEFHKKTSSFAQRRQRAKKNPKKQTGIHKEWMAFNLGYFDVIRPYSHIYRHNGSETSDETKQLETRPYKRNSFSNFNLDSHHTLRQDKKFRPTIGPSMTPLPLDHLTSFNFFSHAGKSRHTTLVGSNILHY
jgi:hypothetical protein